jgi:hypothetical protein
MSDDRALRAWAVEQAIKMHQPSGSTTRVVLIEADELIKFVIGASDESSASAAHQPKTFGGRVGE